jgi:hypothetical protein
MQDDAETVAGSGGRRPGDMAAVLKIRALITECRADIAEWNGESGDDPEYHALLDFLPKLERLLDED